MYRVLVLLLVLCSASCYKPREDKTKCPKVKALRNFDINELMGTWYIVEYYASSEEMPEYSCMRSAFTISLQPLGISMKFNYSFVDDPEREKLNGNITWEVPDGNQPAHWVHAEDTYEGVYNTYVLDSDYNSFGLLLHCAEKSGTERYLSSLVLSREQTLKRNIINYLREKLPRYGVDLEYMFPISQKDCDLESSVGNRRTKKKGGDTFRIDLSVINVDSDRISQAFVTAALSLTNQNSHSKRDPIHQTFFRSLPVLERGWPMRIVI
ncbi:UNVERIFIED_CONTAM: hypothetical protein PYX00_002790 [Menopon gallinae]|uniref:VDE lipocalin domain-containing protein n=1 Tax=Menopon gallinae TaxID=328185 RepID=A0AAW2HZ25_9NEOP